MKLPKLTKRQWIIASAILLLLLTVGVYFYLQYRKKKQSEALASAGETPVIPLIPDTTTASNSATAAFATTAVKPFSDCPNDGFPLKYGKCGKRVEQFQIYLIKTYGARFSNYGVDGKWGDETEAVTKKFILKNEPFSISEDYFNKTGMAYIPTVKYA